MLIRDFVIMRGSRRWKCKYLVNFWWRRILDLIMIISRSIEHLDPPVLEAFPVTTLGTYKPKVMVVSTPNADFNVNFPKLKYGTPESIMRNDDHRFEWTRNEFETW